MSPGSGPGATVGEPSPSDTDVHIEIQHNDLHPNAPNPRRPKHTAKPVSLHPHSGTNRPQRSTHPESRGKSPRLSAPGTPARLPPENFPRSPFSAEQSKKKRRKNSSVWGKGEKGRLLGSGPGGARCNASSALLACSCASVVLGPAAARAIPLRRGGSAAAVSGAIRRSAGARRSFTCGEDTMLDISGVIRLFIGYM